MDTRHQLTVITQENTETKQQLQVITTHITGQDQRMVQLIVEALGGRVPMTGGSNNG
jgi:hypothetical protein